MATYNQMQVQQKPKFSVAITTKGYQSLISNTLRDPARARRFTASITSAVAVNPALQECDAGTILAGALLGESLNLSPSPQLGQYYLVPFKQKAKYDRNNRLIRPESVTAQFVLGYKGYIQLALRSGQYKDLDVMVIKQGEYLGKDPETGKAKFQFVEDDDQRDALPTVGYMAYFEYLNGFRKVLYWSKEKMMTHADTYSKAFSRKNYEDLMAGKVPESEMWKYSSFWYKNFDDMAKKTLLRQLISRWGVMSIEMTKAMESDNAVATVADNNEIVTEPEPMPGASEQPELHVYAGGQCDHPRTQFHSSELRHRQGHAGKYLQRSCGRHHFEKMDGSGSGRLYREVGGRNDPRLLQHEAVTAKVCHNAVDQHPVSAPV